MNSSSPQPFSIHTRGSDLESMASQELDMLVIGGGITGAGVALDAASRGLSVGIVERDDWACGTSSRSSKMIHGGLRYLASGDIGVVRESLRERARIQRNAAHLVRPLSMLLPVYGSRSFSLQRLKLASGLWSYEALGHHKAAGSFHRWRTLSELTRMVPGIALHSLAGGGRLQGAQHYHDASADDVRLVMSVLRTARRFGALAANRTSVRRLIREGGRVVGAVVTGDAAQAVSRTNDEGELVIRAKVVVNAAGVWADQVLHQESTDSARAGFHVMPSKGIHFTVKRDRVGIDSGIAFFEQSGNSNVFIEPWQDDLAIIGTTDTPYDGDLANPKPQNSEVEWLLKTVNQFIRDPLDQSDLIAVWAGLRPLVVPEVSATKSKDISRRHLLLEQPGVLTITGGKLTAYRAMAEHTVTTALRQLDIHRECVTSDLQLVGCMPVPSSNEITQVAQALNFSRSDARHLLRRYGSDTACIVDLALEQSQLAQRIHPERPYVGAEIVFAARYEQAQSVDDVLQRRTRIALEVTQPELSESIVQNILDRIESDDATHVRG